MHSLSHLLHVQEACEELEAQYKAVLQENQDIKAKLKVRDTPERVLAYLHGCTRRPVVRAQACMRGSVVCVVVHCRSTSSEPSVYLSESATGERMCLCAAQLARQANRQRNGSPMCTDVICMHACVNVSRSRSDEAGGSEAPHLSPTLSHDWAHVADLTGGSASRKLSKEGPHSDNGTPSLSRVRYARTHTHTHIHIYIHATDWT